MSENPYAAPQTTVEAVPSLPRHPGQGSPYGAFRQLDVWVGLIVIFFGLYILLDLFSGYASWKAIQFYESSSPDYDSREYFLIARTEQLLGLIFLAFFFVLVLVWCVWTNLSCKNAWLINSRDGASALYRGRESFTPGWVVGWHFIPVMWYWKPFQAMAWIRDASQKSLGLRMGRLLGLWWTFWLLSQFVALVYLVLSLQAETFRDWAMAERLYLVSLPLDICAAVFAVLVAICLSKIQKLRASELGLC
ncbi:MAG: DUF4328 domain-containing protein [Akkermansiaceae bacterium]